MNKLLLKCGVWVLLFFGTFIPLLAQDRSLSGKVTNSEDNTALPGVSIVVKGTTRGTTADADGNFKVTAPSGATLIFSYIGYQRQEVKVGNSNTINVQLVTDENSLDEVVVTALGTNSLQRELGYAVSKVKGDDLAQTQRDNFLNALQGRVPGATITGTSGMPGSSSQIVLRGINSVSGNNQPLFVIDGLPVSNNTFASGTMIADRNSASSISNRTVDFSNRISDINPNDIESMTILKGPEAAALYGIEAANGAIVITTKKGSAGSGGITYSSRFTFQEVTNLPTVQNVYSNGVAGLPRDDVFSAFGPKYAENATLYDNMSNFFQTGKAQQHNLVFSGGTPTGTTYRLSASYTNTEGVVPTTKYERMNVTLAGTTKIAKKITSETTLQYAFTKNRKVSRGQNSFLLGLLQWPLDDDITQYLRADGFRRRITAGTEIENPYFDINKNRLEDKGNRFLVNNAIHYEPTSWLRLSNRVGLDISAQNYMVMYHPESNRATSFGGSIDQSSDNNRDFNWQYTATAHKKLGKLDISLLAGGALIDRNYNALSSRGEKFLDPNFVSINNTDPLTQKSGSSTTRKRMVSAMGNFQASYNDMFYLTITGRNDWTSTLPQGENSFFYPSISGSFVFTELIKSNNILSFGKIRAAYAQVGKDAPPYALYPAFEAQTTTGGGFAYGFTAPAPYLKPEKINSYEVGFDLKFFKGRFEIDAAYYQTQSKDQIITGLRGSYGTGFVLKNINGGELKNWGTEAAITIKPIVNKNLKWETVFNFNSMASRLVSFSEQVPEYYDSDTWVFGNIRNGIRLNGPLTTFTGNSYQRNTKGNILISPVSGLPLNNTLWEVVGDRNPKFTLGWLNSLTHKNLSLSFLWDFRNGGDVYNATEAFLYTRGLSKNTLDRETPRIFAGVLKDGLENSETPTANTIVVTPYYTNSYYSALSDENFIERDIKWARLRDLTLRYSFTPKQLKNTKVIKSASVFFTGTDLFLLTNYTGGDPGVNAVNVNKGGTGGGGIDYGNLPVPKVYNVGINISF